MSRTDAGVAFVKSLRFYEQDEHGNTVQKAVKIPALANYTAAPVMCVECDMHPVRVPGARHCLECSEEGCVLGADDAWYTKSQGEMAIAKRRKHECADCESCFGTGWISYDEVVKSKNGVRLSAQPYTMTKECPGQGLERRLELFNHARCPGVHHLCRFSPARRPKDGGWDPPMDGKKISSCMKNAHAVVQKWAQTVKPGFPDQRGLILGGSHGTGKTHLLVSAIKTLTITRGIQCRYMDWGDLIEAMRVSFGKGQDEEQVLEQYMKSPILILDEFGKGAHTDWRLEALGSLIDRRYRNPDTVTVVATNLDDGNLRTKVGERIMSRLAAGCRQVAMVSKDFRRA